MLRMETENINRVKHMLWLLMDRHVHRYLLVNTVGREDGGEKAEHHLQMSYIYVASRMGTPIDLASRITYNWSSDSGTVYNAMLYKHIHDSTQELTGYMDEVIGFPLEEGVRPDYNDLAPKFFNEFIRIADKAFAEVEDGIESTKFRHVSRHLLED